MSLSVLYQDVLTSVGDFGDLAWLQLTFKGSLSTNCILDINNIKVEMKSIQLLL